MQLPPPDVDGAREKIAACVKRLRTSPTELKDKVAAFGELLSVSHLVPDVTDAVSLPEFLSVLRVFLVNPTRTLRLLALKATQAFCKTPKFLSGFIRLKCDYLLARCMERSKQGEEERTQAYKVFKAFLESDPVRMPKSLIQVLLSVADAKEDPCHAISVQMLIELAIRNPRAMAKCGGMKELFRLMVDPPHDELLPVLTTVFTYLLDDETTRQYVLVPHDIKVLLAPLTDTFQCDEPIPASPAGKPQQPPPKPPPPILGDNRSTIRRWSSCVRAVVLLLKSWSGIFIMAASGGFQSMVSALHLPSMNLHSLVLDALLEVFRIPAPMTGPDFNPFLNHASGDESRARTATGGNEGASGGKTTASSTTILDLPSRSKIVRHDFMLNYLSLLLVNFKQCGLFEALVRLGDKGEQTRDQRDPVADSEEEAMNMKRRENGIKATILLGELLDLSQATLAPAQVKELHTLPTLVRHAATFHGQDDDEPLRLTDKRVRTRAGAMVAHLQQWASMRGSDNHYLEVNTSGANKFRRIRGQNRRLDRIEEIRLKMEWDIDEATLMSRLRATGVLNTKDWNKWDFRLMAELLEGPLTNAGRIEMVLGTKFFKRILSFARPDTNQLFTLPWSARNLRYVQVVCMALEVLTLSDQGGTFLVKNKLLSSLAKMIGDEVEYVQSKRKDDKDRPLSPEKMVRTMVKEYFTLIGTLSGNARGIKILNDVKIFSLLVPLISSGRSDLCKVIMISMDYSQAGSSRVLLSKVLQNKTMPIRYLATRHLHFLLRAGAGGFKSWGIEFACKALKDPESRIVRAIVALLDEASDDPEMLSAFIARKPEVLLEGNHPGKFLVYRFLSTEKGFDYLNQTDFIERELELWAASELLSYVQEVESKMLEIVFSDSYKQTTAEGGVVNMMPHLYGELAKTENGFGILLANNHFVKTMDSLKRADELPDVERRGALWAAAHVGASARGLEYLKECGTLDAMLDLTVTASSLSTRGTCLMALGLLGASEAGRELLIESGWAQPHAEVYRLVAVPRKTTLKLLMEVPQPVYTGGSWTPNFMDPHLIENAIKSAREERVASARSVRAEVAAAQRFGDTSARKATLTSDDDVNLPVVSPRGEVSPPASPRGNAAPTAAGRAIGRGMGRGRPTKPLPPPGRRSAPAVDAPPSEDAPVAPPASKRTAASPRRRKPLPPPGAAADKKAGRSGTGGATVSPRPPRVTVPPLQKLDEALRASSFDANPVKDSFTEDQKTILNLLIDMTSHITTEKALRQLKKMRVGQPHLFTNPETFLGALKLLEMYRFKLMIRRFIYELFGECLVTHQQFRATWDDDGGESRSSPHHARASARRVGLKKDLPKKKKEELPVPVPKAEKSEQTEDGGEWM